MNRFNRDYALVRNDGAILWESHDRKRLEQASRDFAEQGIEAQVVKSDLARDRLHGGGARD